ncbi:MAG: peptide deformylase [Alphaproteobacteria bacterium]|nr:peptide deformylase [Alphaproteobacteria bacterium]
MAILEILTEPDKRLHRVSDPVEHITDDIRAFLNDMVDTMRHNDGIGLAAPQVNCHKRMIVIEIPSQEDDTQNILYKIINPKIIGKNAQMCAIEEGCLSAPGERVRVNRFSEITIQYLDEQGIEKTLSADGLLAICIQHEIDHLDGIVFLDYLSPLKRKVAINRLKRRKENSAD